MQNNVYINDYSLKTYDKTFNQIIDIILKKKSILAYQDNIDKNSIKSENSNIFEPGLNLLDKLFQINNIYNYPVKNQKVGLIISNSKGGQQVLYKILSEDKTIIPKMFLNIFPSNGILLLNKFNNNLELLPNFISACSTSMTAIIMAYYKIKYNEYDTIIIGTYEDSDTPLIRPGFSNLNVLLKGSNEEFKPFDVNRKGFKMGAIAGFLILSKYKNNDSENFRIIDGNISNNGYDTIKPDITGNSVVDSILSIDKELDCNCIISHGTATDLNDIAENNAFSKYSEYNQNFYITAFKPYIGHTLGASGLVETILGIEMINNNCIFPIINTNKLIDTNISDKYVFENNDYQIKNFINLSYGFGGHINSIKVEVLKKG